MVYKKIGEELSFADIAVSKSLEHNSSVKLMDRIYRLWVGGILKHYLWNTTKQAGEQREQTPIPH